MEISTNVEAASSADETLALFSLYSILYNICVRTRSPAIGQLSADSW